MNKMRKTEPYFNFNVNHHIYVKLYEKGYRFWKKESEQWIFNMRPPRANESESFIDYCKRLKRYKEYVRHLKKIGVHPLSWYKKKSDKKGYIQFQTWQFIEIFGKYTTLGAESIYDTNILIKKSDLTPCKIKV